MQAGLAPRLITAKKAQQSRLKKSQNNDMEAPLIDGATADKSDILQQIDRLKNERLNRKLFKIRKELCKAVKIARNHEIQKCVKKLKNIRALISQMKDKLRAEFDVEDTDGDAKLEDDRVPDALLKAYNKQRTRERQTERQLESLKSVSLRRLIVLTFERHACHYHRPMVYSPWQNAYSGSA